MNYLIEVKKIKKKGYFEIEGYLYESFLPFFIMHELELVQKEKKELHSVIILKQPFKK